MFTLMDWWRAADDIGRAEIIRRVHRDGGVSAVEDLAALVASPWPVERHLDGRGLYAISGLASFRRAKNRRRRGRVRPARW